MLYKTVVPLETTLVTSFVSSCGTALVAGATFAAIGAVTVSKRQLYSAELTAASDLLRDVLTDLHPNIRNHHHAAAVLEVMEKNGYFALLNAAATLAMERYRTAAVNSYGKKK
jgi:hypothetical protein